MGRGSSTIFNVITLLFLALTVFVFLCTILMVTRIVKPPDALAPRNSVVMPSVIELPTSTITLTPSKTLTPTNTKTPTITPTFTRTFTPTALPPTETLTPTITLSPTITPTDVPPTAAPTDVPPTKTALPTKTPLPTKVPPTAKPGVKPSATPKGAKPTVAPTQPPPTQQTDFPFIIQPGTPQFVPNFDTAVGCTFQGIAGQVFDQNLQPLVGLQIVVTAAGGFSANANTGSNPRFGQAGWMIQVDNKPNNLHYFVEVHSPQGAILSAKVDVGFPNGCDKNLALLNFNQNRPF